MDIVRKIANNRCEFAREQYEKIIKSFTITKTGIVIDSIAGFKARKLARSYRIYCHYLNVFNGSSPRGTTFYTKAIKKKNGNRARVL